MNPMLTTLLDSIAEAQELVVILMEAYVISNQHIVGTHGLFKDFAIRLFTLARPQLFHALNQVSFQQIEWTIGDSKSSYPKISPEVWETLMVSEQNVGWDTTFQSIL